LGLLTDRANGHELLERGFNAVAAEMTMEESPYLYSGQSVRGGVEGLLDTVSGVVAGGGAEEESGTGRTVVPYGEGSLEMGYADDGSAVERGVDGAEAQDLCFGAAGGSTVETEMDLAQYFVAILPKLASGVIAFKENIGGAAGPVDSAAQFARYCRSFTGTEAAAVGQALAALDAGPEAAVGKAVVGFSGMEELSEFALGDVGNEADVGAGCPERPATIEGAKLATIPGGAEQRRKVSLSAAQGVQDGGEFFRDGKEAAVSGWILIAQGIDKAIGGEASGGDASVKPGTIDLSEETHDLVQASSLAGLTGFANQYDEEIEAVASSIDHAVGAGSDQVAEGSK
jgi:hypothetical protein